MIKLIGKKIGMIQVFDKQNQFLPVTIIKIIPSTITFLREVIPLQKYSIQYGYNLKKKFTLKKPQLGHLLKKKLEKYQFLKEFNVPSDQFPNYQIGDSVNISILKIGSKVKVQGNSIGKGNAGNIKKNSFNRGPMSHGSKHHRLQGSMGSGTTPGRVFPGKKMPGRLGGKSTTILNLTVVGVDLERNLALIKGSIPGKKGNHITITCL